VQSLNEEQSQPPLTRGTCLHRPYQQWAKAQVGEETKPTFRKNQTQGTHRMSRKPPNQALPSHHQNTSRKTPSKPRTKKPSHLAFQPPRQGLMYTASPKPKKNQDFRPHTTTLSLRHPHTASSRSKGSQELRHPYTATRPTHLRPLGPQRRRRYLAHRGTPGTGERTPLRT
jgi:hypothetical protein